MKILNEKEFVNNYLSCIINYEKDKIFINNLYISENTKYETKKYLIYFFLKKKTNDIFYTINPKIFIFIEKDSTMSINLKNFLLSLESVKKVDSILDADFIFTNVSRCDISSSFINKYYNCIPNIDFICEKHKLSELLKNKPYGIRTTLLHKFIPMEVYSWNCDFLICKPINSSCGRGIFLRPFQEMIDILKQTRFTNYIIQEYIDTKLYEGRKFDIRLYVFMDSNKNFSISDHGFLRLAPKKYSTKTSDLLVHLTNTSISKEKAEIIPFDTWSEKYIYKEAIHDVISDLIHTLQLFPYPLKNGFQLLGFDILIDLQNKIRIIEINKRPSLKFINNTSEHIKKNMFLDFFEFMKKIKSSSM